MQLHEVLARRVDEWRDRHYPDPEHDAIGEILEWAAAPETTGFRLRPPQLRALETYWYLRLIEKTPHIFDLYQKLFPPEDPDALLNALGIRTEAFQKSRYNLPTLLERIKSDDDFVREFRLEALRETLTLDYPSYILALAMGAGKTVLIGAIFASEFGMALEYPDGPFVQNALVFAPGKTIIESLRQLAETRYDAILPPRLYKPFAASVKLTFTRDGEKDIPVVRGSTFNVVVTNTEKIRIQKPTVRARNLTQLELESREQQESEVANLRLQAIASLPHLAIFSDEAHHTYGQSLDTELKKVRRTVDFTIQDFISPNILERLKQQAGILSPQIDDWRAMVDSVMIDSAYDGHVFNIALADVPERKSDLVSGEYELAAPSGLTTVAVKITDMLGEEVLEERHA